MMRECDTAARLLELYLRLFKALAQDQRYPPAGIPRVLLWIHRRYGRQA